MPLQPDPPFPKGRGNPIRAKDWNDAVERDPRSHLHRRVQLRRHDGSGVILSVVRADLLPDRRGLGGPRYSLGDVEPGVLVHKD